MKKYLSIVVVFIICFVVTAIMMLFFKTPDVNGDSMEPSYHNSDRLLLIKTQDVDVGDVIIIWSDTQNKYLLKRVIGEQGDVIEINQTGLYRNGAKIYESYVAEQNWYEVYCDKSGELEIAITEPCVFVMGDNRLHSLDSREIGAISTDNIMGKIIYKF